MSDWVLLGIVGFALAYKLIDRWLDQREQEPGEHRATYSTHERGDEGWGEEARTQIGSGATMHECPVCHGEYSSPLAAEECGEQDRLDDIHARQSIRGRTR